MPHHATREGTVQACQDSMQRLKTDRIDLYLLHWRGYVPLADVADTDELISLPGGREVATDQVLYNLSRRAPELALFPLCDELGMPVMAYSPIGQGRILGNRVVRDIALRHNVSAAQIALAWVLWLDGICATPRAGNPEHVYEDRALDIRLDKSDPRYWTRSPRRHCITGRWRCSSGRVRLAASLRSPILSQNRRG